MTRLNIAACLPAMAARHPDKVAIHQWESGTLPGTGGYVSLRYGELDRDSDDIARGLTAIGVSRGVRAALLVPPGPDFFALAFGMAKAGVVPVLVDPAMGTARLKTCLAEAKPEAFIGVPRAHAARVALGWARASLRNWVTVGGVGFFGGHTLDELRTLGRGSRSPALVATQPEETAAVLFTSGSTGVPKGVVYTHANFAAQIESLRRIARLGEGEVDLATFAPFALFDPALGMTTVVPDMDFTRPASADPARLVDAISRFGCTNMFCSPAVLQRIADWAVPRGVRLPSLRRVVSAGAPVPARTVARFVALLSPGAYVATPYGATEALPVSVIDSDELLATTQTTRGVCVGRAVEGLELAVIAISDGPIGTFAEAQRVPRGEIGEVVVRGQVVTRIYDARERETRLAKILDGDQVWHRMGDVGWLDEHDRLWFCGRKAERVQLAGDRTLFTVPCESIFDEHPEVSRSALVGVRRGGVVVPAICIERRAGSSSSATALTTALLALGAAHAHTAMISTFLYHPGFPVDARHNAKIRRDELATWAEARLS